jgi:hypothetical protein
MTTNISEVFNFILKGIRSLPVSGIVDYTFHKCNEYFVNRWERARRSLAKGKRWGEPSRKHILEQSEISTNEVDMIFDPAKLVYDVNSSSRTNISGEVSGGHIFRVDYVPDLVMRKMRKGRRKKKHFHNEMDDMKKGYGNDMYGLGDFDQIKNKIHYSIYHDEGHTMNRHKKGPKRNRRACGTAGRNHRSGATDIIEVRHE